MRIKRMGVSVTLLKSLLAPENQCPAFKIIKDGIPEDAVVCGVNLEDGRVIWLTIESSTFEEVNDGDLIPIFVPTFETIQSTSA